VADELASPLEYDTVWLWLAGCLLLLAMAALAGRPVVSWVRSAWARRSPRMIRERYLDQIAEIARRVEAGELASRQANSELSSTVRSFVKAMTGRPVETMTLQDFEASGTEELLVDAVRVFYDGVFAVRPRGTVPDSVDAARRVVSSWS
jgi:hypothetical protein